VFIFSSIRFLSKKITKPNFLKKKPKSNRNLFKPTGFGSVRFGFLEQKPVQTGLAWFFWFGSVWLGFFWFDLVFFLVFFGSGSVQFGFFGSRLKKPNRSVFSKF
jgi:hypothetical protein